MIEHIIISSFVSYGWCALFWEEMIFNKIGNWLDDRLPSFITKPLFDCVVCNTFWVSTLLYWIWWGDSWHHWIIISIGSVGLTAFIANLIGRIRDVAEAIKPPED